LFGEFHALAVRDEDVEILDAFLPERQKHGLLFHDRQPGRFQLAKRLPYVPDIQNDVVDMAVPANLPGGYRYGTNMEENTVMPEELPKHYEHKDFEALITERWLEADAFAAVPDGRDARYVIMMPLPNVTGALHMGHAMDNVMQDLLVRWRRMMGENTLWMPGTDHAGIGTQAVVEKRLFELEGKTRHDIGREGLVAKIQAWKDEYRERIIRQQQSMGCSCDWKRQRFTMDAVCARAVREAFFRLFRD